MNDSDNEYQRRFNSDGFFIIPDYFGSLEVANAPAEVKALERNPGAHIYLDRNGELRRLEHFTYLSDFFVKLNEKVEGLLSEVLGEPHTLFKDKFNYKPPGGEGFSAHYDGVFEFETGDGEVRRGWHHYAPRFVSVLVAVDPFTTENGALEIAAAHSGDFEALLENTRKDGSPHLLTEVEAAEDFFPVIMEAGGVAVFKHSCPHRSGPNSSQTARGSVYWTYNSEGEGNHYNRYFEDKAKSTNQNKALTGPQFEG